VQCHRITEWSGLEGTSNVNDTDRDQALSLVFIQSSHVWATEKEREEKRVKICLICFHESALWNMLFHFKLSMKRK